MIFVMTGWRGMMQMMPAVLAAGVSSAPGQFLAANFLGPILVDVLAALVLLLRVWQPATAWRFEDEPEDVAGSPSTSGGRSDTGPTSGFAAGVPSVGGGQQFKAFLPYIILVVVVLIAKIGSISKNIPDATIILSFGG